MSQPVIATLSLHGTLRPDRFLPWIARHAARLGVLARIDAASEDCIVLTVQSQPELIDAMEMACWLGPVDVWVERIVRAQ